ncbi:endopeptidase La [Microvenator marinus]|uniref:Lon protease n=1 Tax=Microvenator marinus TaxID=2600177 RepID=A0A5B8Y0W6_9DELT|nr:endopeptidase La [Microvenator marinus]QED29586.1 endopeptidase La [Microvenator marinus]
MTLQNEYRNVVGPLPLIPLRNMVLFPKAVLSINVGRPKSAELVRGLNQGDLVVLGVQREAKIEEPELTDVLPVGTLAKVVKVVRQKHGFTMVVEGVVRFQIEGLASADTWLANGRVVEDQGDMAEASVYAEVLVESVQKMVEESGGALEIEFEGAPGEFADRVAATLSPGMDHAMDLLMTFDVQERLRALTRLIGELRAQTAVRQKIESEVRNELTKNHREAVLRQQLKAIQNELSGDEEDDLSELRRRLSERDFPEDAQKAVDKELKRLESLEPNQAEFGVVRNYLEWMADLPWGVSAADEGDVDAIEAQLDADHFGLDDVKERILEHMAVLQLSGNPRGTILCLAGPPGVGKTSLGKSIADATGRPFVRIALGGVRDEAEIRGHRRTYVGSRPGRIVHALKKAGASNPVILLDEVDKLAKGWSGDPEAALLEVLDPEQNAFFQDHYLEVPFDLSKALFIVTANNLENMSAPLRDRLEIIEVSGYTVEEKAQIGQHHLLPKQRTEHGIAEDQLTVSDDAFREVITSYTREAGVRQLNRLVTKVCRSVALEVARKGSDGAVRVEVEDVEKYLGKPKFQSEVAARTASPGVATGLAWTPVGGDILFIETSKMGGAGQLQITGQLGEVMQESAKAALTYVRSHADELGVDPAFLKTHDVHIHVPAGAVPKDGPSAGVTIFTALTSLLTGRAVRSDTAMTGEATLRGRVMPVGGIKAKVLAAHRAGIKRVILPLQNRRDLDEVPDSVKAELEFHFAEDMSEVLEWALLDADTPLVGTSLDVDHKTVIEG